MTNYSTILQQRQPSLYEQYCCNIYNIGKIFSITQNGKKKIIICPSRLPLACQSKCPVLCIIKQTFSIEYRDHNCKSWYEAGYTISGIYLINPDGGTPFEVILQLDKWMASYIQINA